MQVVIFVEMHPKSLDAKNEKKNSEKDDALEFRDLLDYWAGKKRSPLCSICTVFKNVD